MTRPLPALFQQTTNSNKRYQVLQQVDKNHHQQLLQQPWLLLRVSRSCSGCTVPTAA